MISSMSVPICNRFHVVQANSGKHFKKEGSTASPRVTSRCGSPSKDFVIDSRCRRFDTVPRCDGRTDGQSNRHLDDGQDARSITCCRA